MMTLRVERANRVLKGDVKVKVRRCSRRVSCRQELCCGIASASLEALRGLGVNTREGKNWSPLHTSYFKVDFK